VVRRLKVNRKTSLIMAAMLAVIAGVAPNPPINTTQEPNKDVTPWHDPERLEKAKQKRAMRAAKRLKHRNT
jgi:hypothetical protein